MNLNLLQAYTHCCSLHSTRFVCLKIQIFHQILKKALWITQMKLYIYSIQKVFCSTRASYFSQTWNWNYTRCSYRACRKTRCIFEQKKWHRYSIPKTRCASNRWARNHYHWYIAKKKIITQNKYWLNTLFCNRSCQASLLAVQ